MDTKKKKTSINTDYIKNHLIAYIGNKRRLLDLLLEAIASIEKKGSTPLDKAGFFIDYFAGSGVVSRLAKELGFSVISNDWEYYAKVINKSFLENSSDILKEFSTEGGLEKILKKLNDRNDTPSPEDGYISKYYCPSSDEDPNVERERMFYTQNNGKLIDNIRSEIEKLYIDKKDVLSQKKKELLLALLLYQSSLRANTSGVFKGFHKGFGGTKGDALSRILANVRLEMPTLSDKTNYCKVFQSNANHLSKKLKNKIKAEIVYLDPPYNQHQYGSNYHMLNTIAKNDKPDISKKFFHNGKKTDKSGIRKDWTKTRSTYCYKQTAIHAFKNLIENINAKYLLVSYSTEGIIDFDEMLNILSTKGKVNIVTTGYTRFRGGKQSLKTKTKNIEFVLTVDTHLKSTEKDLEKVKQILLLNNIENICEETFPILTSSSQYDILENEGLEKSYPYSVEFKNYDISLRLDTKLNVVKEDLEPIFDFDFSQKQQFYSLLHEILFKDNGDEINLLVDIIEQGKCPNQKYFLARILKLYQKINPQKNSSLSKILGNRIKDCFSSVRTTFSKEFEKTKVYQNYRGIIYS